MKTKFTHFATSLVVNENCVLSQCSCGKMFGLLLGADNVNLKNIIPKIEKDMKEHLGEHNNENN